MITGAVKAWFSQSSPVVKGLMLLSVTTGVVTLYRWQYIPYARRQRYLEAEKWANDIFEKEELARIEHEKNFK